jgi:single-stranded-DNA-specific exonuclease
MPELFTKFGGHKQAAGLTMEAARVAEFRSRITAYASTLLSPDDFRPAIDIDAELSLAELNETSAEELLALEPFGYGNPEPLFLVRGAEVCGPPRPLGEKGFLVPVRQGARTLMLKTWNFQERCGELEPGRAIDAVLCVQNDDYSRKRGYPGWCALMKDMRCAAFHTMGA